VQCTPACQNDGACVPQSEGTPSICICQSGWRGVDCTQPVATAALHEPERTEASGSARQESGTEGYTASTVAVSFVVGVAVSISALIVLGAVLVVKYQLRFHMESRATNPSSHHESTDATMQAPTNPVNTFQQPPSLPPQKQQHEGASATGGATTKMAVASQSSSCSSSVVL
jgi:hypothetical protein